MCFYQKSLQKNTFKLNYEKNIKNKLFSFKDQLNLLSNKAFISRNYQKLQKIKENSSKNKLQFSSDKNSNLSLKIKTHNKFDKKMRIVNDLINFNSSRNINKNLNQIFFRYP